MVLLDEAVPHRVTRHVRIQSISVFFAPNAMSRIRKRLSADERGAG
jgi:hypothetical protein